MMDITCRLSTVLLLVANLLVTGPASADGPATAPAPRQYDLVFATYLGGTKFDGIRDVCVDPHGDIIVVGGTSSPEFPTTPEAFCRELKTNGKSQGEAGPMSAFVAKFDPAGRLIWSTLLGGGNYDRAYGVETDPHGNIYVAGRAGEGFPTTARAFQPNFVDTNGANLGLYGKQNGFVAKLTPEGKLMWASYVGSNQLCRDIAVDDQGDVYLPAAWNGVGTPPPEAWFANAFQKTPRKCQKEPAKANGDTYVLKVSSDGSRVLWATWISGSAPSNPEAMIRVDAARNVYFLTTTQALDMPTAGAGQRTFGGEKTDCYLAKLSPDGAKLLYGTYLGGPGNEGVDTHELVVDARGNAYVAVQSYSVNWAVTPGAFQPKPGEGDRQQVVCKIGPDGAMLACSYLGAHPIKNVEGISVDDFGNVYVTGATPDPHFPMAGVPFQADYGPDAGDAKGSLWANGYLTVIAPDFKSLIYSSYMGKQASIKGENGFGGFHASVLAPDGSFIIVGSWHGPGFPTRNALQPQYAGGAHSPPWDASDAVLARFIPRSK